MIVEGGRETSLVLPAFRASLDATARCQALIRIHSGI